MMGLLDLRDNFFIWDWLAANSGCFEEGVGALAFVSFFDLTIELDDLRGWLVFTC